MNLARSSNFVMNADKFYLAQFCFKYDGLVFRYIGMGKIYTQPLLKLCQHKHIANPCHLELKVRNTQADKGKPRRFTQLCEICPVCDIV